MLLLLLLLLIRDEDSGEGGVGCRKFGRKEIKSERVAAGPRHSHSLQLASLEPSPVLSTSADIGGVESTSLNLHYTGQIFYILILAIIHFAPSVLYY